MTKKQDLVNETLNALNAYIKDQNLQVGDKLPTEPQLATLLKVGRSTLREAVKVLVYSNVLVVKQGSGTYLKSKDFQQTFSEKQLLEAKTMIEIQAASDAATADLEVAKLLELKEKLFERNKDLEEGKFTDYVTSDLEFHVKVVELSGNPFLIKWYKELYPELKRILSTQMLRIDAFQDTAELHNQIYEAIVEHDPQKARAALLAIKEAN